MKKLLFIIVIVFMVGCKKDKTQKIGERIPPMITSFSFTDINNNDLLNTANPNAFEFESFRLFYVEDGAKVEVYNNMFDHPRNMSLSCGNQIPVCVLTIELSDLNILEILGTNISDTISYENDGKIIRYNGEVVWDASKDEYRIPIATIIK